MTEADAQEIHISDYLNVVLNRKGVVISFFLITVAVTAVFSYTAKPVYQASSKLVVGANKDVSPLSGRMYSYESYYAEEKNFNTHFKLITSKPVLKLVANTVDLNDPEQQEDFESVNPVVRYLGRLKENIRLIKTAAVDWIRSFFPSESVEAEALADQTDPQDRICRELAARITVAPVEETRIMEISVMDTDPVRTREIANALAQKYIEFDLSTKLESSTDKLKWMTDELYGVKKKLEDAEKEFIQYKQGEKMFSMEAKQKVINQKIANFNNRYLEARNNKLEMDAKLNELTSALGSTRNIMQIKSMVDDPIIKDLYTRLTTLEIEKAHLLKVYKSKHPKLVEVSSKIDNTQAKLKIELEKKLGSLKRERNIAAQQESQMKKQIASFETEAMDTSEKELHYNIHQRNVNTSQQLYDILLSQIKESNILQSSQSSDLTIVERADTPEHPVKPNKSRNFLLSVILGLFGGVGLAFFLEYLDQTIRNEEDAQNVLGYPVIAIVPEADISKPTYGGY